MSWDVYLKYGDVVAPVENHTEGGTYAVGGVPEACLNITYNYGEVLRLVPGWRRGLRATLDGQKAGGVIPKLAAAVKLLGTHQFDDYWAPTPGNAGYALNILLTWARQHPTAVFEVR